MRIFENIKNLIRGQPQKKSAVAYINSDKWNNALCTGYTSLENNPEVMAAVDQIAQLVASMTIYLMENGENGDKRIKNGLSNLLDISPNPNMNRSVFINWIVKTMLLKGNSVVIPKTSGGYLTRLDPVPPSYVSFLPNGDNYKVIINGKTYDSEDILHFAINPDILRPYKGNGYTVVLSEVVSNLAQARVTKKSFMKSKWQPSLIVRVDASSDEFSSPEGRKKLRENYLETDEAGRPWILPFDMIDVKEVRPLTLSDLAIADTVKLDKQTVASILGVPGFLLGVGTFNRLEWNNFISSRIKFVASILEQEFTKKLLVNPLWYYRFNQRSLMSYDLKDIASVAYDGFRRGLIKGNEARDWINLSPTEGLDELIILENYIPLNNIANQNKLNNQNNGGESGE